jgi:hypothetical protein
MGENPAEKDGAVLETQTSSFQQNESYHLHWTNTQVLLPGFNVERRFKVTWTVCLSEAGGDKAKVFPFPPEVIVVAQEGRQLGRPLGGGKAHQKSTFPNETGKGQFNRPVLKNIQNLKRIPKLWLSTARGPLVEDTAHQLPDERMVPNSSTVDGSHCHGKRGPMDRYGAPRKALFVEVGEVI